MIKNLEFKYLFIYVGGLKHIYIYILVCLKFELLLFKINFYLYLKRKQMDSRFNKCLMT